MKNLKPREGRIRGITSSSHAQKIDKRTKQRNSIMTIIITGAAGFLGDAIVRKFAEANIEYIGVTRKETSRYHQVATYADAPGGEVLIHLAENSDRSLANSDGLKYEYEASRNIRALLSKGYQKVIYASSAVLYGDAVCKPHVETAPVFINDTYTRVKFASEQTVLASSVGCVVRLSNLYGLGMARSNVISHILHQLNLNGPLSLRDTTPIRDFLWIDDVAEAIFKMVFKFRAEIFNLGTGIGTSILDVARMTLDLAGQKGREIESIRKSDKLPPSCLILNADKATSHLDWRPKLSLQDGLKRIVSTRRQMELK